MTPGITGRTSIAGVSPVKISTALAGSLASDTGKGLGGYSLYFHRTARRKGATKQNNSATVTFPGQQVKGNLCHRQMLRSWPAQRSTAAPQTRNAFLGTSCLERHRSRGPNRRLSLIYHTRTFAERLCRRSGSQLGRIRIGRVPASEAGPGFAEGLQKIRFSNGLTM